MLKIILKRQKG